jgi:hypothetical protein
MQNLTIAAIIIAEALVGLLGLVVIYMIWTEKISLVKLLSEPNGDASLSRFQFLIFTLVIGLSFLIITIGGKGGPAFPSPIPPEVLTLLGISGSSYLISKGIQFSNPAGVARPALRIAPAEIALKVNSAPPALKVALVNAPESALPSVSWGLDAPAVGTIEVAAGAEAIYRPAPEQAAGTKVTIRAKAAGFEDGTCVVTY